MTEDHTWASDVEIVAVSCILNSDVFIATQLHDAAKLWRKTIGIDILAASIVHDIQRLSPITYTCTM